MSESLNDKVVGPVPSEQARDGARAGLHSCMDCGYNSGGVCSKYGDACSIQHHCASWDMTAAADAAWRERQRAAEEREARQREELKAERGRDALAKKRGF